MQPIGIIMWSSGAALAAFAAFGFDTSVAGYGSQRIINMGLQQQQLMMLIAGAVLFVVGVGLHAASFFQPNAAQSAAGVGKNTGTATKEGATVVRLAYARQLGITETVGGYRLEGLTFASLEDAITAAKQVTA